MAADSEIANSATTVTLEESLDGTGGLNKLGAGTLALNGNNTYSGATLIQEGTLLASANTGLSSHSAFTVNQGATLEINGVSGTIQALSGDGDVKVHSDTTSGTPASLQVAGTVSSEFSGVIGGDGDFTKGGPSQLILSGDNIYTGVTRINGGVLVVDGSLSSSSSVSVNSLGTLSGGGTVGGDVTLFGTGKITAGAANKALSVGGNLTFAAASTYLMEVSPSSASLVNVAGHVNLNDAKASANFASAAPGAYIEKQYLVLHADNGIGGTFSTYTTTNLPTSFKSSLSKGSNNNDYYLNLTLDFTSTPGGGGSDSGSDPSSGPKPPSNRGLPTNQSNVGNALTNFFNSTGRIPMAFGSLTPQTLTQVSGEVGSGGQHTNFQASSQFMNVMGDVTSAGRGFANGGGGALGYADDAMAYAGDRNRKTRAMRSRRSPRRHPWSLTSGASGRWASAGRRPPTAMRRWAPTRRRAASMVRRSVRTIASGRTRWQASHLPAAAPTTRSSTAARAARICSRPVPSCVRTSVRAISPRQQLTAGRM